MLGKFIWNVSEGNFQTNSSRHLLFVERLQWQIQERVVNGLGDGVGVLTARGRSLCGCGDYKKTNSTK